MPNTDPRAVNVVNNFVRPGADRFVSMVFEAQALLKVASVQGTQGLFPGNAEQVEDGAPADGRPAVSNLDVLAVLAATQMLTVFANSKLQTGNPALDNITVLDAFIKCSVNPVRR